MIMASSSSSDFTLSVHEEHNMIGFIMKPPSAQNFTQIVDFLRASYVYHALTVSPRVSRGHLIEFWKNARLEVVAGVNQVVSKVQETKVVVTEEILRDVLLLDDATGITSLDDTELFDNLRLMGYEGDYTRFTFFKSLFSPQWKFLIHTILHCLSSKRTSYNEFGTQLAYFLVCLAKGQKYNFSKYILDGMIRNITKGKKDLFIMYPRFVQLVLNKQITDLVAQKVVIGVGTLSARTFTEMSKNTNKKFSGKEKIGRAHV